MKFSQNSTNSVCVCVCVCLLEHDIVNEIAGVDGLLSGLGRMCSLAKCIHISEVSLEFQHIVRLMDFTAHTYLGRVKLLR